MHLKHNINKVFIINGIRWFMLLMPIIVLFFEQNGLSLTQIMLLPAIYSLTVAILEIPSGFFADTYGRKKSIILSTIFYSLGYLIFSFSNDFNIFIVAEILLGIGGSLISGSDSAIMYDTLLELNKENEYSKIEGKSYAIGNFSEAIAGLIASLLVVISIYLPVYIHTLLLILSIPIAFTLVEPKRSFKLSKNISSIFKIFKETFASNNKLMWLIIYSAAMGLATLSIAWFVQPFLIQIDFPLIYYGLLWAALNFSSGITSYFSHYLKDKNIFLLASLALSLTIFLISFNIHYYAIILFFIIYFIRGIVTPHLRNHINLVTSSEKRATVLSIRSLIIRLSFSLTIPIFGYISENYNISYVFILLSFIVLIISLISSFKLSRD